MFFSSPHITCSPGLSPILILCLISCPQPWSDTLSTAPAPAPSPHHCDPNTSGLGITSGRGGVAAGLPAVWRCDSEVPSRVGTPPHTAPTLAPSASHSTPQPAHTHVHRSVLRLHLSNSTNNFKAGEHQVLSMGLSVPQQRSRQHPTQC